MTKVRGYTRLVIISSLLVVLIFAVRGINKSNVSAQVLPTCVLAVDGVSTTTAGSTTPTLTGLSATSLPHSLRLTILPATFSAQVKDVYFTLGDPVPIINRIGRAIADTSIPSSWVMPWYAQVTPRGSSFISASVSGVNCTVIPYSFNIPNLPAIVPLTVSATPVGFSGYTNEALNFAIKTSIGASSTGADVSQFAIYDYLAQTLGSISPIAGTTLTTGDFRFSAGPVAGTGNLNIIAHYGGFASPKSIPVNILPQPITIAGSTSGTVGSTPTPTPSLGTTGGNSVAKTTSVSIEADPVVKSCVTSKLTDARYLAISSGQARPTAEEFLALNDCFADRNHILPSGFVPVAPSAVKSSPVTKLATITNAVTQTTKIDTIEKTAIKFTGKSTPNSVVIVYVFSEPLVLSVNTDSNGDWSYNLEDPLQPGQHEAYAMVSQGDGSYARSSIFNFAIAKVEASPANPNGYSLKVQSVEATATENNRPVKVFVAAIVSMIFLVLGVMSFIIVRKRELSKHAVADTTSMPVAFAPAQNATSNTTVPITPAQPALQSQPAVSLAPPPAAVSINVKDAPTAIPEANSPSKVIS